MITRHGVAFLAVAGGLTQTLFGAVTINIPAGSGLMVNQRVDPSLIEHFPLNNFISWEVFIRNPNQVLTFTGGTGQFYDANGSPILGVLDITPAIFANVAVEFRPPGLSLPTCGDGVVDAGEPCDDGNTDNGDACNNACMSAVAVGPDGSVVPMNSNIGLPFPFEFIPHNVVPGSVDMVLCFKEFEGLGGVCDKPLEVLGVTLLEYTTPPGDTYIYPLPTPGRGTIFSGGGHEIGKGHRLAFNQRFAYDVTVQDAGAFCDPCNTNEGAFIHGEPVLASAAGVVTVNAEGHAENTPPGATDPNVGLCPAERCDGTSPTCMTPGGMPGGGNMTVLGHNNGEFSFYAHMITGSNDATDCDLNFAQGAQIGQVGNSGSSSGPHIHFHNLPNPNPDDPGSQSVPAYYTNIQFATPGYLPKRQLETAVPSGTFLTILSPPAPIPSNMASASGAAGETEPNNKLSEHHAITFPTVVTGIAEAADVGDTAVRGDGIEDIYRVDFANPISLRINLSGFDPGQNLDVYVLTENMRVLNPTREGTTPVAGAAEQLCLTLQPGAYYILVTNVDSPNRAETPYVLELSNDQPVVDCSITNPVQPVPVDENCEANIDVSISITDDCCLDPSNLDLTVEVTNPTNNATVGPVTQTGFNVQGPAAISAIRQVKISDLTSCPATIQFSITAKDCGGLESEACVRSVDVIDTIKPEISCPPPITLARGDKICNSAVQDWLDSATATDNCPGLEFGNDAPKCGFPFDSTTTVIFTATDDCGNTDSCTSAITIRPAARGAGDQKGSLLVFSDVEIRWDDEGRLVQDTILDVYNDADTGSVDVQAWFINGDRSIEEIVDPNSGDVLQEFEPGWNTADCRFELTKNQPHYWSAARGSHKCQPFTVLDEDGRPGGSRILRGYVVMVAVKFTSTDPDPNVTAGAADSRLFQEIRWNHLKGDALVLDYEHGAAWEYNAIAYQARCGEHGEPLLDCVKHDENGTCCEAAVIPGRLDLDGFQYDANYDVLLLDFYASGSTAFTRGNVTVMVDTDLTLHTVDADLRQDNDGPVLTKAEFEIFNQNESKFSGLRRCFCCWDQTLLSNYVRNVSIPSYFMRSVLGTDKGMARIDGVESSECDYEDDCGIESDGELMVRRHGDTPLLGVAAKELTFSGAKENYETAGMNLPGSGTQSATIRFDVDPICGDGEVNRPGEECDDGSRAKCDGCSPDCTREFCGDGVVCESQGETCEPGGICGPAGTVCSDDCRCLPPDECSKDAPCALPAFCTTGGGCAGQCLFTAAGNTRCFGDINFTCFGQLVCASDSDCDPGFACSNTCAGLTCLPLCGNMCPVTATASEDGVGATNIE